MGRHSSGERRSRLAPAAVDVSDDARSRTGAAEDLRMLLGTRKILLFSVAAVVMIFAAYFLVLTLIGHQRSWLLLIVVPAGLSGVTVGALLDHAHRERPAIDPIAADGASLEVTVDEPSPATDDSTDDSTDEPHAGRES
jgi:hypothetical protein